MIRLINYIKEEKKKESDYSMNKDINPSLIPQEYSNNTNQSSNLPSISLNNSNQSNCSNIIPSNNSNLFENFKKVFPSHAEILEKQIESYIAGEEMNKFIKEHSHINYTGLTKEEKKDFISKILKTVKRSRIELCKNFISEILNEITINYNNLTENNKTKLVIYNLLGNPYSWLLTRQEVDILHLIEDCILDKMKQKFRKPPEEGNSCFD